MACSCAVGWSASWLLRPALQRNLMIVCTDPKLHSNEHAMIVAGDSGATRWRHLVTNTNISRWRTVQVRAAGTEPHAPVVITRTKASDHLRLNVNPRMPHHVTSQSFTRCLVYCFTACFRQKEGHSSKRRYELRIGVI